MSQHTAPHMRWHVDGHTKDGILRHLVHDEACKSFVNIYLGFASNSCNVSLGLSSDGFNQLGT